MVGIEFAGVRAVVVQEKWTETVLGWRLWAFPTVVSLLLIIVAKYDFLTFHTLAELFTIVISFVAFALAWTTFDFSRNAFLIFLACGYFWVGSLDLLHALAYKGMNLFVQDGGNTSIQLWIVARASEATLLLSAPLLARRELNKNILVLAFGIIAVSLATFVLSGTFPVMFIDGAGLTAFKINSEYAIDGILFLALIALFRYGRDISVREKVLIALSIVMTMCAELAFTFYVDVYGISNLAGHIFKIFSFWLIFQAIVISNLKRPFFELESLHKYNRNLLDLSTTGLALCKMDGTLVDVNSAYAEIIGCSVEETLDLDCWQITPEKYMPQEHEQMESLTRTGKFGPYVKEYIRKDGSLVPVQLSGRIIERDGEQFIWSSVEDITERRKLEGKLRQSQKMEAVGQLTGGIAHDFNNMLAVISGNLSLIEEDIADGQELGNEQLWGYIKPALEASRNGAALTHRLLAFARKQPLRPVALDVNKVAEGMEGLFKRTLGEDIDLSWHLESTSWLAEADASELENVLLNLALNARDAMPMGGKLTIETNEVRLDEAYAASHTEVTAGDYMMLAVSDTGTGMDAETLEKVFEPFFTTKEVGKGTGLGLSMVYGFVKQSHGHVAIYSELGQGTVVKLYLPRAAVSAAKAPEKDQPAPLEGAQETILVVEDEVEVRRIVVKVLERHGYTVLEAEDGESALSVLENAGHIDLLLSDVVLPGGMSGPDMAKAALGQMPGLKVLYMSGYTENAFVHHGHLDAGVHLIGKPFSHKDLRAKIQEILDS